MLSRPVMSRTVRSGAAEGMVFRVTQIIPYRMVFRADHLLMDDRRTPE
jgi:hypothetical protein